MSELSKPTRRRFLLNTGMLAAGWELSCTDTGLTEELRPTPSCHDGDEPTIRQTEGPFFKWTAGKVHPPSHMFSCASNIEGAYETIYPATFATVIQ
jgi:hypothetical protein